MSFQGGPKEAARMLALLDPESRKRIMGELEAKDPKTAQVVRTLMVTLDDLKFLTIRMLQEFLKTVSLKELGLALRRSSPELKEHLLSQLSLRMREEVQEILQGPPQPKNIVEDAEKKVLKILLEKVEKGEIVLSKDGKEQLV
ncbi:MAG: hypothetical protein A2X86_18815 [Bdellovibrionales bacterium GWA2_49_15]|nr:MAG: hypothetical protein A2X86_18815 [Bdellovibrionales bacterium GWA2_49_15]HAZ14279.1 hypothetical protein [Bdellovibrionales bacterium]